MGLLAVSIVLVLHSLQAPPRAKECPVLWKQTAGDLQGPWVTLLGTTLPDEQWLRTFPGM